MAILKIENLSVTYSGTIKALQNVNLEVNKGEIVVLIGANGAGKTTLLKALSGLVKADNNSKAILDLSELTDIRTLNRFAGEKQTNKLLKEFGSSDEVFKFLKGDSDKYEKLKIRYNRFIRTDLMKVEAHKIINFGICHVPEGRQIFANLTVEENLEMGAFKRKNIQKIKKDLNDIYQKFPRLEERKKQRAGTLSGGEQQMLAVARALMSKPKIIFLDEPSMGLAPLLVKEIFEIIKELNKQGITILLVEQNAKAALSICDRAYVLETGSVILEGTGEELLNNEKVLKAYLG